MVPSLHWLLLLGVLQGLWAQDHEEEEEDEMMTSKKKSKLHSLDSVVQNGKRKLCSLWFTEIKS